LLAITRRWGDASARGGGGIDRPTTIALHRIHAGITP